MIVDLITNLASMKYKGKKVVSIDYILKELIRIQNTPDTPISERTGTH